MHQFIFIVRCNSGAYGIETIYRIYAIYTIFTLISLCFPLLSIDGPYSSGLLSHWFGYHSQRCFIKHLITFSFSNNPFWYQAGAEPLSARSLVRVHIGPQETLDIKIKCFFFIGLWAEGKITFCFQGVLHSPLFPFGVKDLVHSFYKFHPNCTQSAPEYQTNIQKIGSWSVH